MKEHYFVVKYSTANGWEIDPEVEGDVFPDGTVWNCETKEWETAYEGDGVYNDEDPEIVESLMKMLGGVK